MLLLGSVVTETRNLRELRTHDRISLALTSSDFDLRVVDDEIVNVVVVDYVCH